jgi:hypothetical protein
MKVIFKYRLDQLANFIVLISLMHAVASKSIGSANFFIILIMYTFGIVPIISFYRLKYLGIIDNDKSFFQLSYFKVVFLTWKHWSKFNFGSPFQK